ncbi:hypothetical protein BDY24DRAFT_386339 [Mrakia frigida]|uniref:uncharacterized protein n=1 Tax=Mrakia frigida TaxID=29902 RepID=UPI003FCC0273
MDVQPPTAIASGPFVQLPTETIRDIFDPRQGQTGSYSTRSDVQEVQEDPSSQPLLYFEVPNPRWSWSPCSTRGGSQQDLQASQNSGNLSSWRKPAPLVLATPQLRRCLPASLVFQTSASSPSIPLYSPISSSIISSSLPCNASDSASLSQGIFSRWSPSKDPFSLAPNHNLPFSIPSRFVLWVTSRSDATWVNQLLFFFHQLGVEADYLELTVVADVGLPSALLIEHDVGLKVRRVSTATGLRPFPVSWNITGEDFDEQAWVVWYEGDVPYAHEGDKSRTLLRSRFKQAGRHREGWDRKPVSARLVLVKDPTPISRLLMTCSVEEVRAALTKVGLDSATFDASPLSILCRTRILRTRLKIRISFFDRRCSVGSNRRKVKSLDRSELFCGWSR